MIDEICRIVPNSLQREAYGGAIMAATSRKDSKGRKLHTGESQRKDGDFQKTFWKEGDYEFNNRITDRCCYRNAYIEIYIQRETGGFAEGR